MSHFDLGQAIDVWMSITAGFLLGRYVYPKCGDRR